MDREVINLLIYQAVVDRDFRGVIDGLKRGGDVFILFLDRMESAYSLSLKNYDRYCILSIFTYYTYHDNTRKLMDYKYNSFELQSLRYLFATLTQQGYTDDSESPSGDVYMCLSAIIDTHSVLNFNILSLSDISKKDKKQKKR